MVMRRRQNPSTVIDILVLGAIGAVGYVIVREVGKAGGNLTMAIDSINNQVAATLSDPIAALTGSGAVPDLIAPIREEIITEVIPRSRGIRPTSLTASEYLGFFAGIDAGMLFWDGQQLTRRDATHYTGVVYKHGLFGFGEYRWETTDGHTLVAADGSTDDAAHYVSMDL